MNEICPKCGKKLYSKIGPDDNIIVYCNSPPYGCGYLIWRKKYV